MPQHQHIKIQQLNYIKFKDSTDRAHLGFSNGSNDNFVIWMQENGSIQFATNNTDVVPKSMIPALAFKIPPPSNALGSAKASSIQEPHIHPLAQGCSVKPLPMANDCDVANSVTDQD